MARIKLEDIGLTFRVKRRGKTSLKEYLIRRLTRQPIDSWIKIRALDGVTFELRDGDRVGVIGHNGAGKSTLLRLLAGVYPPTQGSVDVQGKISSLFDVAMGFEPDCSGWENIAFRGYLQGETPTSIAAKKQRIAEFSDLGEELEMPIRYYSTGMVVRLGFSIATAIEPEIMIIDEILSAGDKDFQEKARTRIREMLDIARIVVLASHDLDAMQEICNRVIWMDHGKIRMMGHPEAIVEAYSRSSQQSEEVARAA